MRRVFLDHNATTRPSERALSVLEFSEIWGNPSSIYESGRRAKAHINRARRSFAEYLGVKAGEIIFTSGGSEANNLALRGMLKALKKNKKTKILSTWVEHPSVVKTLDEIAKDELFDVLRVPVSLEKGMDYQKIEEELKSGSVGLVSMMSANNETGEIFDINAIGELCEKYGCWLHSDMVQVLGKMPVDVSKVHLASFSGHKFYSLKGTGVLFQRKGVPLEAFIRGGGQERGRRAGTENALSIMSFGAQLEALSELEERAESIARLRDQMEEMISREIQGVRFIAKERERLPNSSMVLIEGLNGETLLMNLDLKGFEISTGAACSSGNPEPSPVLLGMGLSPVEASGSLRISLGWQTTGEEVDLFVSSLKEIVERLRSFGDEKL